MGSCRIVILDIGGDKSFAYDLNMVRGSVSARDILLYRGAELKPLYFRFVLYEHFPPPIFSRNRKAGRRNVLNIYLSFNWFVCIVFSLILYC